MLLLEFEFLSFVCSWGAVSAWLQDQGLGASHYREEVGENLDATKMLYLFLRQINHLPTNMELAHLA